MPATALSKGLSTLGSWLPAETSLVLSTPSRQLRSDRVGLLTLGGAALRCRHARLTPQQLQPRQRWAWPSGLPTTQGPPCRCSTSDDGSGGGAGGNSSSPVSEVRWRLEEGGTEAHSALNVVLVSPQIPGNAGSIARTCAAAGVRLHLVEPMGFQLDDAKLKRAGLDYWPYVCVAVHSSWAAFMDYYHTQPGPKRLIGFSKKATTLYTDVKYRESDWLLFGSETQGFPEAAVGAISREGALVRIPMSERHVRSLNLSVSVGIGLFESLRQLEAQRPLDHSSQHSTDPLPGAAAGVT